ncbi:MAG TPA: LysM peptidoglycan-binding domain-containing protein, partial [Chloroflexaceae bacterium]|nr:LysM peptidoglycan-binding domain-containing protein [Chloroflexaceae bacterium]
MRARGLAPAPAHIAPPPRRSLRRPGLGLRAVAHASILGLVALVLAGELAGAWSAAAARPPEEARPPAAPPAPVALAPLALSAPLAIAPLRLASPALAPVEPPLQRPNELAGVYQAYHPLDEGETLGAVAERYGVGLDTVVWSNGLDRGDALLAGQLLRVPRLAGLPHTVADGETLEALAERYGVDVAAIVAFAPNGIGPDLRLRPGVELFIPGGRRLDDGDWLGSLGGVAGLAARGPEPAGVGRETQTNLPPRPSTLH